MIYIQLLKKSKTAIILLFFIDLISVINGQNIVYNSGFEEYSVCPENYTEYSSQQIVNNWTIPTFGTPDYFNECSNICGIPTNWAGESAAHSGKGYIGLMTGFYLNGEQLENKREYLQTKLLQKLQKDELYLVKFYTKSASSAIYYTDAIGIYLSKTPVAKQGWSNIQVTPQIRNLKGRILNNKKFWTEICVLYKAKGEEEYLTIGNFENNKTTQFERAQPNEMWYGEIHEFAYYYIDDISVVKVENEWACNCEEEIFNQLAHNYYAWFKFKNRILGDTLKFDENLILDKVHFEFNKSDLLPDSYKSINLLVDLLNKKKWKEIILSGYTDSIGTEEYNYNLSFERAKKVADYLILKGIDSAKITYKGMGSKNPVTTFKNEYARALNRRVEIRIASY